MAKQNPSPETIEELDLKVQATFIQQEHRLWQILQNFIRYSSASADDPRRNASRSALLIRLLMSLIQPAVTTGVSFIAVLGLLLAWHANQLIEKQNALISEQNTLIQSQLEEQVSLEVNPNLSNGIVQVTDNTIPSFGQIVQFPWKITISNNGSQQLFIVEYRVMQGDSLTSSAFYSGIDGGLFDEDGQSVKLPIKLDAGETRIFHILVGIPIPLDVFELFPTDINPLTDRELSCALAKEGIDIFGNSVTDMSKEFGTSEIGCSIFYENAGKSLPFFFEFTTGRGNKFSAIQKKYDLSR
ncbi:MAG: hypothetical protein O3A14_11120 [Cyanobacteria bacterium]|nr:hypothetical protein [Cyanobacteriota bacterium]